MCIFYEIRQANFASSAQPPEMESAGRKKHILSRAQAHDDLAMSGSTDRFIEKTRTERKTSPHGLSSGIGYWRQRRLQGRVSKIHALPTQSESQFEE